MMNWRGSAPPLNRTAKGPSKPAALAVEAAAILLLFAPVALAQSANALVRAVVDHELREQSQNHTHWMYLSEDLIKKQTKAVIQTKDGDLSRLLAVNGHPLTAGQQKAEDQRIEQLLADPQARRKLQQDQRNDSQQTEQLFKMLPDAWSYTVAQRNGDDVRLNFKPNPDFNPPSNKARALHEMTGHLDVNAKQMRLMVIAGTLMQDVKFGWLGVLGHLAKGGTFDVHQQEVAPGHWEVTVLKVNMRGKALFFKTINVRQNEVRSHFGQVPSSLTLAEAEARLRSARLPQ